MPQLHVLDQSGGCNAVIPSIEMAAAGLDSIGAIVGYAVCSGISITSGSLVYSILSGPLQVLLLRHLPAVCAWGLVQGLTAPSHQCSHPHKVTCTSVSALPCMILSLQRRVLTMFGLTTYEHV